MTELFRRIIFEVHVNSKPCHLSQWLASLLKRWFVASMYNQSVRTPTVGGEQLCRKEHRNTQVLFASCCA